MTYKPGDIFLTTIDGGLGVFVRLGQQILDGHSDYHHAGIILHKDGTMLEAKPDGARISNVKIHEDKPLLFSSQFIEFTDEERAAIVETAYKYVGTPYSFVDYLSIFLHRLRIPSKRLRAYVRSSKRMICSQLADHVWYEAIKFDMFRGTREPQDVTPANIADCWARHWNLTEK